LEDHILFYDMRPIGVSHLGATIAHVLYARTMNERRHLAGLTTSETTHTLLNTFKERHALNGHHLDVGFTIVHRSVEDQTVSTIRITVGQSRVLHKRDYVARELVRIVLGSHTQLAAVNRVEVVIRNPALQRVIQDFLDLLIELPVTDTNEPIASFLRQFFNGRSNGITHMRNSQISITLLIAVTLNLRNDTLTHGDGPTIFFGDQAVAIVIKVSTAKKHGVLKGQIDLVEKILLHRCHLEIDASVFEVLSFELVPITGSRVTNAVAADKATVLLNVVHQLAVTTFRQFRMVVRHVLGRKSLTHVVRVDTLSDIARYNAAPIFNFTGSQNPRNTSDENLLLIFELKGVVRIIELLLKDELEFYAALTGLVTILCKPYPGNLIRFDCPLEGECLDFFKVAAILMVYGAQLLGELLQ